MALYEKEHIDILRKNAAECTLFLNRNDAFPISKPGKVLLIGSGARETIHGGGGSGETESRYYTTCEEGLEDAGFEIVSKDWFFKFAEYKKQKHQQFIKYMFRLAEKYDCTAEHISFGNIEPQPEYTIELDQYEADIAIYVISRTSSEGNDRTITKGDLYLTDSEVRDILFLNKKYDKFLLVLNTVGPVDLSPVKSVSNILLLTPLGIVTGDILADIILGKVNPSGKLATTWASVKDYKFIEEFGGTDNVRYVEGVYVGYRYFDSANIKPLYPFGYGKSYTDFSITKELVSNKKDIITINVKVKNIGKYKGKEVVEIYVSPSQQNKDKPYQSLVAFKKTKDLEPGEEQSLSLTFKLSDVARYDEDSTSYILDRGTYIVRVGNSSDKTNVYCIITLNEDIVTEKLKHVGGESDFGDVELEVKYKDVLTDVEKIELTKDDFTTREVKYDYQPKYNELITSLSMEDVGKVCICNFNGVSHLFGEAGETVLDIPQIKNYLVLADGPAGLRLVKKYGEDENGKYRLCVNPIEKRLIDYLSPEEYAKLDTLDNNKNRKGEVHFQFATAIPIATALAQSFNEDFLELVGDIVAKEMEIFGVNLWLAPGLNIHRNVLNGRNFEYFSEDPLISGKMAGALTRGVQSHQKRGTTIKHLTCNNQEHNRFNSNSIVSERALREIYLRGFKIAIESSNPVALMTSYNLLNGVHPSERVELLKDVVRSEWGYEGLIMSDWFNSGVRPIGLANHPSQYAVNNIMNGNNLQMGGGKDDYDLVMEAYREGKITKDHLYECASKVYETIEKLNQEN
ncbi:MAG: glycoside hydrolase family 3 C-terminal domain-containing protein [Bacilli bacterium]|nr:glycoside hydrolase family 3 C-terminal domain-containing protein [Bacilli bacterium]